MTVAETAARSQYEAYVYAYPHKTAYRPLDPRPPLREVWAGEARDALSLYLHVPFCEMRCGFCNLFTRTGAPEELAEEYLDALDRQARAVRAALDEAAVASPVAFATAAFGGGTPTYLSAGELARLCDVAGRFADLPAIPLSVETSPATATADRLAVLAERGVTRVSIGVQTFVDAEAHAVVRPQRAAEVDAALDRIRAAGFRTLNIDLMYGIPGQTPKSWVHSLLAALRWHPEELYLYPLYVRPLTGLAARTPTPTPSVIKEPFLDHGGDRRPELYQVGRDLLLAHGYEQVSMRMFRRRGVAGEETAYCCQTDGMVGLGAGARSYTTGLHYSFEYAVHPGQVRRIIDGYLREPDFGVAHVGFAMDDDDRRRRHLIQSLLQVSGLDRASYRDRFGGDALADFPELADFAERGLLVWDETAVRLTPTGLAYSDAIGPALFSARVRALMDSYEAR